MKQNNVDNGNNDENRKPPTAVVKLLHFRDKQNILHDAKQHKIAIFFLKKIFQKKLW